MTISSGNCEGKLELSYAAENLKGYGHFGEQFGSYPKLNIYLPYGPSILLLSIFPGEMIRNTNAKTLYITVLFIGALFVYPKTRNSPTVEEMNG